MLRGVVYRLIGSLASMGHCSIWKLICVISVCNTLTVGVHLSSTPGISGAGSATECYISSPEVIGLLVLGKRIFKGFLPYMGVAAILVM